MKLGAVLATANIDLFFRLKIFVLIGLEHLLHQLLSRAAHVATGATIYCLLWSFFISFGLSILIRNTPTFIFHHLNL